LIARARYGFFGLALVLLLLLPACAGSTAARRFGPAGPDDVREALSAWTGAVRRAEGLPPSRLLYDAKMGTSGLPSVPGTLAALYDGERIQSASLTGPFGSHVAEYRSGVITGEDRKALVVDPEALRNVLAGVWIGAPDTPMVVGRSGPDCLLTWSGSGAYRAEGVLDLQAQRLRSLALSGGGGRLSVSYSGELRPWPERIALKEDSSGRSLSLSLVATEPLAAPTAGRP
jgi:hypothetical protein